MGIFWHKKRQKWKNQFLFNSWQNNHSFDMSHAIFLKNEKMTKWAFFALKSQKRQKSLFTKNAKKIFSPVMRRFQNAKDIENPLKTSLFTKEKPHFGPPKNGLKKIEKPKNFFSKKQKKYLEIILKYTLCQIFVKIG